MSRRNVRKHQFYDIVKCTCACVWQYNLADFNAASNLLNVVDSENLSGDINHAWENWKQGFISVMEQCVPHVTSICATCKTLSGICRKFGILSKKLELVRKFALKMGKIPTLK